jgi:hypothetical protein
VLARFWQAERHAQGVSDVAWEFKMLLTHKFALKNFVIFYQILENSVLPAILPWLFLSMTLQSNILYRGIKLPTELLHPVLNLAIFNFLTFFSTCSYLLYERFKRKANSVIYNGKNESILRVAEYLALFSVNMFGISVPTFTIAAFGSIFGKREYVVA